MNIDVALHPNGIAVVHLAGYLDPRVVTTLKQRLAALIGSGHARLVVDLASVTFMNRGWGVKEGVVPLSLRPFFRL